MDKVVRVLSLFTILILSSHANAASIDLLSDLGVSDAGSVAGILAVDFDVTGFEPVTAVINVEAGEDNSTTLFSSVISNLSIPLGFSAIHIELGGGAEFDNNIVGELGIDFGLGIDSILSFSSTALIFSFEPDPVTIEIGEINFVGFDSPFQILALGNISQYTVTVSAISSVPEPITFWLMAVGVLGLMGIGRQKIRIK